MRMTKPLKNNPTNATITLPNSKTKTDISLQTPIEIALKIDENGMTTASNLYAFLELDSSHFSRWCNKNITNNKFTTENNDYIPFAIEGERHNPKPKQITRSPQILQRNFL